MTATSTGAAARTAPAVDVGFFAEHGWLHVPEVFAGTETRALARDLDLLIDEWAIRDAGWNGAWRHQLMDEDTAQRSELIALHDLQLYSATWAGALLGPRMAAILTPLLGNDVELHHSTMHVKPPETGHPFPPHQDHPFYPHADDRYVDVLIHLDDTNSDNGEIRFVDGSHRLGPLRHRRDAATGAAPTPYLSAARFPLEAMVAVPARSGDLVLFSINTIHGSYINRTDRARRLVRAGYRHPANTQLAGQAKGRPGPMLAGYRARRKDQRRL